MISKFDVYVFAIMMWVFYGLAAWLLFREGFSDRMFDCLFWGLVASNALGISNLEKRLDSQATDDNQ